LKPAQSGGVIHRTAAVFQTLAPGAVSRGDLLVVEGAGAYCSGMSSKNYNSFPEAPEVMKGTDGKMICIRAKQSLEQILANEVEIPDSAC